MDTQVDNLQGTLEGNLPFRLPLANSSGNPQ